MILYRHPFSGCSRRVLLAIHELGIADRIELRLVDLPKGEQRAPSHLAINPNGKVPVLDDDGYVLWESHAIMQYLADGTPKQTLYPTAPRVRADINRWMFWHGFHFSGGISTLNRERVVKRLIGAGAPDPAEVARGESIVRQFGAVLDNALSGRDWLVGNSLSLADLAVAADLAATDPAQLPVLDFKNLQAWFARIRDRESWKYATTV